MNFCQIIIKKVAEIGSQFHTSHHVDGAYGDYFKLRKKICFIQWIQNHQSQERGFFGLLLTMSSFKFTKLKISKLIQINIFLILVLLKFNFRLLSENFGPKFAIFCANKNLQILAAFRQLP